MITEKWVDLATNIPSDQSFIPQIFHEHPYVPDRALAP